MVTELTPPQASHYPQHVAKWTIIRVFFRIRSAHFGPIDFELFSSPGCSCLEFGLQRFTPFQANQSQLALSLHSKLRSKFQQNPTIHVKFPVAELYIRNWPSVPRLSVSKAAAWFRRHLALGAHSFWHPRPKCSIQRVYQFTCHFERNWGQEVGVSPPLCSLNVSSANDSAFFPEELWELLPTCLPSTNNNGLTTEMAESDTPSNFDPHLFIKPRRLRVRSSANPKELPSLTLKVSSSTSDHGSEEPDEQYDDMSESGSSEPQQLSEPLSYSDSFFRALKPPVSPRRAWQQSTMNSRSRSSSRMTDHSQDTRVHEAVFPLEVQKPRLRRRHQSSLCDNRVYGDRGDGDGTFGPPADLYHAWSTGEGDNAVNSALSYRPRPASRSRPQSTTPHTRNSPSALLHTSIDSTGLVRSAQELCYGSAPVEDIITYQLAATGDLCWSLSSPSLQPVILCVPPSGIHVLCCDGPPSIMHFPYLSHQHRSFDATKDESETLNFTIGSIEGTETQRSEIVEDDIHPLFYTDAIDDTECHTVGSGIQCDTSCQVGFCNKSTHSLQSLSAFNEPAQRSLEWPNSEASNQEANRELFEQIHALYELAKCETARLIPDRLDEPESLIASCDQLRALICQLELCCSHMRTFGWLPAVTQPSADSGCIAPKLRCLWADLLRYAGTWFVGLQKAFAFSKSLRHLIMESQHHLQRAKACIESQLHHGVQVQSSDSVDIPLFCGLGTCALDGSRMWNDIQGLTEFGDLPTALHLAKVIHLRLSDWFAHLKFLLLSSADSEVLFSILALESHYSGLEVTGIEATASTDSHRLELLRLHSFVGSLLSSTETLFLEWKRRVDRSQSHRTVAHPLECSEDPSGMSHGYPQLQLKSRSRSLNTNMNDVVLQGFAQKSELMTSSNTEDNIEELVSVTSRSSISSVSDTSEDPISPELLTDTSSSSEVTAHSLVPSEAIPFPPNTWSITSTPFGYPPTDSESLRIVQSMTHGDIPALNGFSLDSGQNIPTSGVDDDEQCNTMSTLKESSETCERSPSSMDANRESRTWDTALSRRDKHSLEEDSQCELPPEKEARFSNFGQPSVPICAWLLQFTNCLILRAKQRIIGGDTQDSLLPRDPEPHASSQIQLYPDMNRLLAKCLLLRQRVTRGVSYGCLWLSRPVLLKVLAATFFLSFMLMFLPLVVDWALSIPISHAHSSCSYRWFTGSWLHASSDMGPQRTISKSWPNAAPPF